MSHYAVRQSQRQHAKSMRRVMSPPELRLWQYFRTPSFPGPRFRRQVPIGPYIVDFLCAQEKLVIEVDGSHHALVERSQADVARDRWLTARGYRVMRFWSNDIFENIEGVGDAILAAMRDTTPSRNR